MEHKISKVEDLLFSFLFFGTNCDRLDENERTYSMDWEPERRTRMSRKKIALDKRKSYIWAPN